MPPGELVDVALPGVLRHRQPRGPERTGGDPGGLPAARFLPGHDHRPAQAGRHHVLSPRVSPHRGSARQDPAPRPLCAARSALPPRTEMPTAPAPAPWLNYTKLCSTTRPTLHVRSLAAAAPGRGPDGRPGPHGDLCGGLEHFEVGEDFVCGADSFGRAAFHEALEVGG